MKISKIITKRKQSKLFWWDLVFEWEDCIKELLNTEFEYEPAFFNTRAGRLLGNILCHYYSNEYTLLFEMGPSKYRIGNKNNIIPWIIDFYPTDSLMKKLYKAYSKNPVVLVSSKQVYDYLLKEKYPMKVKHLALSLPDKYSFSMDSIANKTIDLIQCGRISKVMLDYTNKYASSHPEFRYVYRKWEDGHNVYYYSDGEKLGIFDTREEYWSLIRQAKVAIYTTSGMDGDKATGSNFHQVTPRFLELVSSGCHVISRYSPNSDTNYFELEKFGSNVQCYEDFEKQLDYALNNPIDKEMYSSYLKKHYTSQRVLELKTIINEL